MTVESQFILLGLPSLDNQGKPLFLTGPLKQWANGVSSELISVDREHIWEPVLLAIRGDPFLSTHGVNNIDCGRSVVR